MNTWTVEPFKDDRGRNVIAEFLADLRKGAGEKAVAKVLRSIDMLAEFGFELPDDALRKVTGTAMWELRTRHAGNQYRILTYNPAGRLFVLLHGILKKDHAIPESDKAKAERRMEIDRGRRKS